MKAVLLREDHGEMPDDTWIIIEHVRAVVDVSRSDSPRSEVYIGGGEDDYFLVKMTAYEFMTRAGFNEGDG